MMPQQFDVHRRRVYLSAADKSECTALDAELAELETRERLEPVKTRPIVQRELLMARQRYRQLKC